MDNFFTAQMQNSPSTGWNPFGQSDVPGMVRQPTKGEQYEIGASTGKVPVKIELAQDVNGDAVEVAKGENGETLATKPKPNLWPLLAIIAAGALLS